MEAQLTILERKIDDLLASVDDPVGRSETPSVASGDGSKG
jgi:hypothetical protein